MIIWAIVGLLLIIFSIEIIPKVNEKAEYNISQGEEAVRNILSRIMAIAGCIILSALIIVSVFHY